MRLLALTIVALLAGCANTPKYYCEAGENSYYADHYSAFIMTDDKVIIGDCKPTSNQAN